MYNDQTSNGIPFKEELISSQGVSIILFPQTTDTPEMINTAKQELRISRDIVRLTIANDYDMDDNYKEDIFRHPAIKPLRWYEIEQDDDIIRRERLKGTTTEQFVERLVLPFVEQTKAKYLAKYGDSIYL